MKTISSFVINRDKWCRGQGSKSKILDEESNRDCLGFYFQALGVVDDDLLNADEPIDVKCVDGVILNCFDKVYLQTDLCTSIISVNDTNKLTDTQREQQLINLFQSCKIDIQFKN